MFTAYGANLSEVGHVYNLSEVVPSGAEVVGVFEFCSQVLVSPLGL